MSLKSILVNDFHNYVTEDLKKIFYIYFKWHKVTNIELFNSKLFFVCDFYKTR